MLVNKPSCGVEEIMSAVDLPVAILATSKTKHEMVNLKPRFSAIRITLGSQNHDQSHMSHATTHMSGGPNDCLA